MNSAISVLKSVDVDEDETCGKKFLFPLREPVIQWPCFRFGVKHVDP
uniref:Uncharacterized protein n=1 Tax=mine drainage metagenome TaxID=410659 RepID=E6PZ65_9ZZZZ